MKKFIVLSIILLMLAGFVITSSADEITLWAGQNEEVGTLTVEVVGKNLVVTFIIDAPWVLEETHLYVGLKPPTKSAPGKFPYGPGGAVYTIPLSDFGEAEVLYIAAHAVVVTTNNCEPREETAWARWCDDFTRTIRPGKNWATYFKFPLPY